MIYSKSEYYTKLKNINFIGLPHLDYSVVFRQFFYRFEHYGFPFIRMKQYLHNICYRGNKYSIDTDDRSRLLFFLGEELTRKIWFEQINFCASLFDTKNTCYIKTNCNRRRNLFQGLCLMFYSFFWFIALLSKGFRKIESQSIVSKLFSLYMLEKEIKNLILDKHLDCLVVLNDANLHDAFIVERFHRVHKKTISLQHGFFSAPRKGIDLVNVSGIEFLCFHSDYFLIWNEGAFNEAERAGIPVAKLKICGLLHKSYEKAIVSQKSKKIGVLLSGKDLHERNLKILSLARELAANIGYGIILRPHPLYGQNDFDDLLDFQNGDSLSLTTNSTLESFASSVEFTILGNSSAFLELLDMLHPVYQYHNNSIEDKFPKHSHSFSSYDGLKKLYDEKNKYDVVSLRKNFLPEVCSEELYREALEDIMKD